MIGERGEAVAAARVEVVALPVGWQPSPFSEHAGAEADVLALGTTGEDGRFAIDAAEVPAGLHALRVSAPGRATRLVTDERVAFGQAALPGEFEIVLPEGLALHGLVLDSSARPRRVARWSSPSAWAQRSACRSSMLRASRSRGPGRHSPRGTADPPPRSPRRAGEAAPSRAPRACSRSRACPPADTPGW